MPEAGFSRRRLLQLGGGALAAELLVGKAGLTAAAGAQTPKRGGTLTIRGWDPPNFDSQQLYTGQSQIISSFTHSLLLRFKAGPEISPGTFVIESDLAESWSLPSDTVYVFRIRQGVRWHNKPPVNGRELTADDVKYSFDRFVSEKGNSARGVLATLDRVVVIDRYTVKLVLKSPFAWLLQILASPMTLPIIARECVETFGDLKRPEAVVGTGPWMLETYRRHVGMTFVRHPDYFVPGLPYIDRIELVADDSNAGAMAAFLAGRYDLGWDAPGLVSLTDWVQIRDRLKVYRPNLRTLDMADNRVPVIFMRTDRPPFRDVRVRQAISLAMNRRELIDLAMEGMGVVNPPLPAALTDWALPIDQLGEGARYYEFDPPGARRLLAEAGYSGGFQTVMNFTNGSARPAMEMLPLLVRYLKDIGIEAKLVGKEFGAFAATVPLGQFDAMGFSVLPPPVTPYGPLFLRYFPGESPNAAHVDDAILTPILRKLELAREPARQKALVHEFQRHAAKQQYYVHLPSPINVAVWDGALKNYGPNISFDYGGRLAAAWLDR